MLLIKSSNLEQIEFESFQGMCIKSLLIQSLNSKQSRNLENMISKFVLNVGGLSIFRRMELNAFGIKVLNEH